MTRLDKRVFLSLKVLFIALIMLIPVGITMAMSESEEKNNNNYTLSPAKETNELEFESIEIVSMRTATSKTFDNGDGSHKAVIYTKPIHYQDGNDDWQEIDDSQPKPGSRSRAEEECDVDKDCFICGYDDPVGGNNKIWNMGADDYFLLPLDSTTVWKKFRILIEFDISAIPANSDINSATIKLDYFASEDSGGPAGEGSSLEITANPITRVWAEGTSTWGGTQNNDGATWLTTDGSTSWSSEGGDYSSSPSGTGSTPSSYGETDIDIKSIVESWVTGTANHGVVLRGTSAPGTDDYLKRFHSSEYSNSADWPKLVIDYISNLQPELLKDISPVQLSEDQPDEYIELDGIEHPSTGVFTDPDVGDTLSFYVYTGTRWAGKNEGGYDSDLMTVSIMTNGTLEISLKSNQYGSEKVDINATDSEGASIEYEVTINVQSVNDPPVINETTNWIYDKPEPIIAPGILTCAEDQWANFTVTAWDPVERNDDDKITFDANTTKSYASFFKIDSKTGRVSMLPRNSDVGIYYLQLTANDGQDDGIFTFTLEIENVNDKPVFEQIEVDEDLEDIPAGATTYKLSRKAQEDHVFDFIVHANDEDLDLTDSDEQIQFRVTPENKFNVKTYAIYPKRAYVNFTPDNDDVGTIIAQITATDQDEAVSTLELEIDVVNQNDPPEFKRFIYKTSERTIDTHNFDLEKQGKGYEATEYEPYVFKIEAEDPDPGDELVFAVKIIDRGEFSGKLMYTLDDITGKPNTKQITVTPDKEAGREGELWVNITVTDKLLASNYVNIRIPVENTNDPPEQPTIDVEIRDADKSTGRVKENLSATFTASYPPEISYRDPDGQNETDLIYSWDFGDGSDPVSGWENIVHTFPKAGTYTVTLTVTDSEGLTNTSTKDVEVIKPAGQDGDGEGDDDLLGLGSVGGVSVGLLLILLIIVIIIIIVLFMMVQKKKEKEKKAEEEAQQAQMASQYGYPMAQAQAPTAAYYQDPAMMAQYQAYQQQYQQMMMQQQAQQQYPYGYDQTALTQQLEGQPYTAQQPTGYEGTYPQQQQTMTSQPLQTATLSEGPQAGFGGTELPTPTMAEQPQLPPAPEDEVEPEIPASPYAEAETQTLEEEIGEDAAVAEVPVEPAEEPPEPEIAPEPELEAPEPEPKPTPAPAPTPKVDTTRAPAEPEGEGKPEKPPTEEKKCPHCSAPVKEGWFLCPKCKKPLI